MTKTNAAIIILIAFSFLAGIYLYPLLPSIVASHWNASGQVNGHEPKTIGLFLVPVIALVLYLFFLLIPKIDPLKENYAKFRQAYDSLVLSIVVFLLYIHTLTLMWNLRFSFDLVQLMAPGYASLFWWLGAVIGKAKRNWFVGIRTPWTISSDVVWDKTHRVGGRLLQFAGTIALLGLFFPRAAIVFMVGPVVVFSVYLVFYSYFEYQKEASKKQQ